MILKHEQKKYVEKKCKDIKEYKDYKLTKKPIYKEYITRKKSLCKLCYKITKKSFNF